MYTGYTGACHGVGSSLAERCRAISQVVRPWEVAHLVEGAVAHAAVHGSLVQGVACYVARLGLRYQADPPRRDTWCSAGQTLRRGWGDCDDFSILAMTLLTAVGVQAAVVLGWHEGQYHAWVAGRCVCGTFFVMEPQNGKVWHTIPSGYNAEYLLTQDRCMRVNRQLHPLPQAWR